MDAPQKSCTVLIVCPLCRVSVEQDKVAMPARCRDKSCPLNPKPTEQTEHGKERQVPGLS
jgi:hypothetical protein